MEEIMKNPWIYIGGGIAFVIAIGYFLYKQLGGVNDGPDSDETVKGDFLIKRIEALSYEFLIGEVKELIRSLDLSGIDKDAILSMSIVPNKLAQEFIESDAFKKTYSHIEISESEKGKMVILSIVQSDKILGQSDKTLISEFLIPKYIKDDYHDVVEEDKIYIRKIVLKDNDN